MKKIITLCLALALVLSVSFSFASCSNKAVTLDEREYSVKFETISARKDMTYSFPEFSSYSLGNTVSAVDYGAKGNGTADDTAAIKNAVADAANKAVVFASGKYLVKSDITVPENVTLVFADNASLVIEKGVTVTINSDTIVAGFFRIFDGEGKVAYMKNVNAVRAEWFGAAADDNKDDMPGISKAMAACGTVILGDGRYVAVTSADIPADHSVSVIGAGHNSTFLIADSSCPVVFTNEKTNSNKDFHIGFMQPQTSSAPSSKLVRYHGTGKVVAENMYIRYFNIAFDLENTKATLLNRLDIQAGGIGLIAKNCTDTKVIGTLCHDGEGFMRLNGGSNIDIIDSSGVWNHATDYEVINFTGLNMIDSSTDLGYNLNGKALNKYAIYFEKVSNFVIKGCWVATNGGLSGTCYYDNPGIAHIRGNSERYGIYITNSDDGLIAGNSINNHTGGVIITNSPANAKEIIVEGNSFNGNGSSLTMDKKTMPGTKCCISLTSAKNITVQMNFFNRYPSGFGEKEMISDSQCSDIRIIANSFSNYTTQEMITSNNPKATLDSNQVNIH